ncbi:Na+/H+ antiporter family protein [[Clostridium] methylpentosum DSM 5476]|uniref:Na+/H+ antiporter family protein n=1 Tax=[Clostridium] methylpentosum DSM 5476 TaxID=537013 RepID=C0EHR7_9FIRM|nr:Na+/H+ antiporter family protein [[Clostridium] methylpentosum DSM 5476]MDY3988761.1 Na+/H+ antiporter NhaC family protein [Massilioclostridium sp.]
MQETVWALVPAIVAIALALLTKEVYISLLIGILSGALFFTNFHLLDSIDTTFQIMSQKVGENTNILVFLVLLGMLVALMKKSGASRAYGEWASASIKTKRGASFATMGLGSLIFVDDYFNCLTVGTVMRPVTDRHRISRAKLAYIIDATAAPICIIAPISSWAAAVGSSLPEGSAVDGFSLFLQTIPFNLYALLTIVMVVFLLACNFDFGRMKKYEEKHQKEFEEKQKAREQIVQEHPPKKGRVFDLVVPIAVLILLCILAMLYTGGILEGKSVVEAFANCNSSLSLVYGSFFTILFVFVLYIPRRVITFHQFSESITEGFQAMVPAILILTLAWTLSGVCGADYLNAGGFVSQLVDGSALAQSILPAVFFLVSAFLAFATGTSWGTFGILIPIAVVIFGADGSQMQMLVLTVAAILAGAVCGDHMSPISDTTILSSTGADCNHIEHVSTQIPYALLVAACCFAGYLLAGVTQNGWLGLLFSGALLLVILTVLYRRSLSLKKKQP